MPPKVLDNQLPCDIIKLFHMMVGKYHLFGQYFLFSDAAAAIMADPDALLSALRSALIAFVEYLWGRHKIELAPQCTAPVINHTLISVILFWSQRHLTSPGSWNPFWLLQL